MKNIFKIKNTLLAVLLSFVGLYTTSAQTVGGSFGSALDYFVINNDNSNNFSQVRLQTNQNAFSLSNFGSRFGLSFGGGTNHADSGNELFSVLSSGNIGIGTNSPDFKLQINGGNGLRVENGFSMGGGWDFNIDAPNIVGGRVKVLSNGNVGIGINSPTQKLDVFGNANINGNIFLRNVDGIKSIYTWDVGDPSWRIGMNVNPGFNRAMATSHVQYLTYGSDTGQGFAIGVNGGNSSFEVTGNHTAYFRGNVGIGTINPTTKLHVNGRINATDYAVVTAVAADYVFEKDYKLMSLSETEAYIKANKHLPAFKSAKHYEANGYTMIEMNVALEQTVEEMTLHAIAQEKKIAQLEKDIAQIKAMLLKK